MNRKEFIKTGGRFLILAGMAATTGYLVANQKVDTNCSVSPTCKNCGQFSGCDLPKAIETKRDEQPKKKTP